MKPKVVNFKGELCSQIEKIAKKENRNFSNMVRHLVIQQLREILKNQLNQKKKKFIPYEFSPKP